MEKTVMITGASSGIGEACAMIFAGNGWDLVITGRREEKLLSISDSLSRNFNDDVLPLVFDVMRREEVDRAIQGMPEEYRQVDVLVNNAGLALGREPLVEGDADDWDVMIDTNVKGLLYVTKALLPLMVQKRNGHIINIGSIAGREVYPNGNVYCSTKFAVDALTKAMQIDLNPYGIRVTQVSPSAVETEFSMVRFKGDQEKAKNIYKGFSPLTGKDVAEAVYFCATRPPHVNIHDMLIMPSAQANATIFNRD